ncbi:MAG: hypothetical protein HYY55_03355 [Candidatus Niyogibacteria bacterium]|nr:MAG: hypothetical protein HYY55_03355 [Candidatus Niyogibacteria bacterium]
MSINLLPEDYQNEVRNERIRRLAVTIGVFVFLTVAVNIILLSPLWFLFNAREAELTRELDAVKRGPAFLRATDIESEIRVLNAEIAVFNSGEKKLFEISPAIKSILSRRPSGIGISGISFYSAGQKGQGLTQISISGVAKNRELLLNFAKSNETNEFFKKVNSPISNLLKENNFDYSLVFDLDYE